MENVDASSSDEVDTSSKDTPHPAVLINNKTTEQVKAVSGMSS